MTTLSGFILCKNSPIFFFSICCRNSDVLILAVYQRTANPALKVKHFSDVCLPHFCGAPPGRGSVFLRAAPGRVSFGFAGLWQAQLRGVTFQIWSWFLCSVKIESLQFSAFMPQWSSNLTLLQTVCPVTTTGCFTQYRVLKKLHFISNSTKKKQLLNVYQGQWIVQGWV